MLRLSKLADYATVIMNYLATHPNKLRNVEIIAKVTYMPPTTVSKLLKLLKKAGLVTSKRGINGGYQLAEAAEAIPLIQIITAVEGYPALTDCSKTMTLCRQSSVCAIKHNWQSINRMLVSILTRLTLAEMTKPLNENLLWTSITTTDSERKS